MEVLIMKIESIPVLNEIRELTDIFNKVVHILMNINPKRNFSRFGQFGWQSFIKEAQIIKYGVSNTE